MGEICPGVSQDATQETGPREKGQEHSGFTHLGRGGDPLWGKCGAQNVRGG